jgi:hypothetical protein
MALPVTCHIDGPAEQCQDTGYSFSCNFMDAGSPIRLMACGMPGGRGEGVLQHRAVTVHTQLGLHLLAVSRVGHLLDGSVQTELQQ